MGKILDRLLKLTGAKHLAPYVEQIPGALVEKLREEGATPVADIEAVHLSPEVISELGKLLDNGIAGVLRQDLMLPLYSLVVRTKTQSEVLHLLQGYVSEDHFDALTLAMAADNLRRLGKDEKSQLLIRKAERRYGADAKKIHNLYSAGYVPAFFLFQRNWFWFEDAKSAPRRFRQWFEEQLKFFDRAIFVNQFASKSELVEELRKRMVTRAKPQDVVVVWAAGVHNVELAVDALEFWVRGTDYDYASQVGNYGRAKSVRFTVFRKSAHPAMRGKRLPKYWESE